MERAVIRWTFAGTEKLRALGRVFIRQNHLYWYPILVSAIKTRQIGAEMFGNGAKNFCEAISLAAARALAMMQAKFVPQSN